MRLLLDTHVALWWFQDRPLPDEVQDEVATAAVVTVSVASVWEIQIKKALGKLEAPDDIRDAVDGSGFALLPIKVEHALAVGQLPAHHRDPFDRMLIAQALTEDLVLVSADPQMSKYDVRLLSA